MLLTFVPRRVVSRMTLGEVMNLWGWVLDVDYCLRSSTRSDEGKMLCKELMI